VKLVKIDRNGLKMVETDIFCWSLWSRL